MNSEFSGCHVVVTGGCGGLGRSVVLLLAERGATIHVPLYLGDTPTVFDEHSYRDSIKTYPDVDLSDESRAAAFYEALPTLWGSVHLSGGFSMSPLQETSLTDFETMFRRNAVTCFLSTREAAKKMQDGGRIVNVAARVAVEPAAGMIAYSTSKCAVAGLSQASAAELAGEGILVNAILPSIIDTPNNREAMPDADHSLWPKPSELAETIAFLVSPRNATTTGSLVPVYGRA